MLFIDGSNVLLTAWYTGKLVLFIVHRLHLGYLPKLLLFRLLFSQSFKDGRDVLVMKRVVS